MQLPPLNAVRAFDAVARLGSVRAAAEALSVTPAAVSQQVRVLEAHLGVALTRREGRGLALTDAGRDWHGDVSRHLEAIALAAERMRPGRKTVNVTVAQSLSARWLLPRLPHFMRRHPDVEVRIDANRAVVDLSKGPFDLALRLGSGRYRGTESALLFAGDLYALASPDCVRGLRGARGAIDWRKARLLHEVGNDRWPDWFGALRVDGVDLSRGLYFSHTMMALEAAVQGQGVALAPLAFAQRELTEGTLQRVVEPHIDAGEAAYVVWPSASVRRIAPAAAVLRDWLLEQAEATCAAIQPHEGPPAGAGRRR